MNNKKKEGVLTKIKPKHAKDLLKSILNVFIKPKNDKIK